MSKVMAGHQPNFIPYAGFFDKMRAVDELGTKPGVFVINEDSQYVKREFHNRNRIRTSNGSMWLRVPVQEDKILIKNVKIKTNHKIKGMFWNEYNLKVIEENYHKALFFKIYFPGLKKIFLNPGNNLSEFNKRIIVYLAKCFGIRTKIVSSREINYDLVKGDRTGNLIRRTKFLDADIYLSGAGGKKYLEFSQFGRDISLVFQDYKHPIYPQQYEGFEKYMSALDVLFNIGRLPRSGETINYKPLSKKLKTPLITLSTSLSVRAG